MQSFVSDDGFEIVIVQAEAAKRGRASIWTVYYRPRDYPTGFVARMFEVHGAGPQPTQYAIRCMELDPIREKLSRAGLICLPCDDDDEPEIVESWV
jgi:hypothetical protein